MNRSAWRRGEGHVEYIIITGMLSICALVGFWSFLGDVRDTANRLSLCLHCERPLNEVPEDGATGSAEDAAAASEADAAAAAEAENEAAAEGVFGWLRNTWGTTLPWWRNPSDPRYWIMRLAAFAGGAPHSYDYIWGL